MAPFCSFYKILGDTENVINSAINTQKENIEYTFTIKKQNDFIGLIALKNIDKRNRKIEIGY